MELEPLIYVSDLKKSIKFYTEILGFKIGKRYPSDKNPSYAPIFIGKHKLMLVASRESNLEMHPGGLGGSGSQFFIKVGDVTQVHARLRGKVTISDDIEKKSWGDREFTIKDPDGYLISFYTPTK